MLYPPNDLIYGVPDFAMKIMNDKDFRFNNIISREKQKTNYHSAIQNHIVSQSPVISNANSCIKEGKLEMNKNINNKIEIPFLEQYIAKFDSLIMWQKDILEIPRNMQNYANKLSKKYLRFVWKTKQKHKNIKKKKTTNTTQNIFGIT